MIIVPHRGSKLQFSATDLVNGEKICVFALGQHHDGRPSKSLAVERATTAFADMNAGVERSAAGEVVDPVVFEPHELTECGWGNQWLASDTVGGEGIYIRASADSEEHARQKLGTMMRHLHDGEFHRNAFARVADHLAKQSAVDPT